MSKELKLINVNDFKNTNLKNVEVVSESIYKLAKDSLLLGKTSTLENSFKEITKDFEKISNCIGLNKPDNSICYHFGRISSLTNIILEISSEQEKVNVLKNISKSYTLLLPALQAIKKHNTISGVELQKELNLKASSNLSNFLKRIDKYGLITIRKIGTINYVSLTEQGEKLLSQYNGNISSENETELTITQLYCILDCLIDELSNSNASSIKIIHKCVPQTTSVGEKRLLKQKFDRIFYVRDNYIKTKLKSIGNNNSEYLEDEFFEEYKQDDNIYDISFSY